MISGEIILGEEGDINPDQQLMTANMLEMPGVNYDLQNEVIKFFLNNPGVEPEVFRQYASSLGVEPEELQLQANILLSQLLNIYMNDAEQMGYSQDIFDSDAEIDPTILGDDDVEEETGEIE